MGRFFGKRKERTAFKPLPYRKGEKVLYYGTQATVMGVEKRLLLLVTQTERKPFPCDPSLVEKIEKN